MLKDLPANARVAGNAGLIPGSGISPGGGNGNPLQYSCLENLMDGGAWWATLHGVAKCQTHLANEHAYIYPLPLEFPSQPPPPTAPIPPL